LTYIGLAQQNIDQSIMQKHRTHSDEAFKKNATKLSYANPNTVRAVVEENLMQSCPKCPKLINCMDGARSFWILSCVTEKRSGEGSIFCNYTEKT